MEYPKHNLITRVVLRAQKEDVSVATRDKHWCSTIFPLQSCLQRVLTIPGPADLVSVRVLVEEEEEEVVGEPDKEEDKVEEEEEEVDKEAGGGSCRGSHY